MSIFIYCSTGKRWKLLSDFERKPFILRSEKLREEHMRRYPDYKYRPKKKAKELAAAAAAASAANASKIAVKIETTKINSEISKVMSTAAASRVATNNNKLHAIKPTKQQHQSLNNIVRKIDSNTTFVNIASKTSSQCMMPSGKPFMTLSRQVGRIGSLSSSDGNFSSAQKTILPKTSLHQCQQQQQQRLQQQQLQQFTQLQNSRLQTQPLTPPPSVSESIPSPVTEVISENNTAEFDLGQFIDTKTQCDSSLSSFDYQTAPIWTHLEGPETGFELPVSPLSDIVCDVDNLYTTPEVNAIITGHGWIDGVFGF